MKKKSVRHMVLTAMFACLAFVLNTFVYFPAMAPFQHFVNVMAAVFVGPWYGFASALLCGVMRMMSGRTIQAVTGAIFGPILGGLIYRKTKNIYLVAVGEIIGTGFLGAMASYPFYTPAAVVGASMGVAVLLILKRSGALSRMLNELEEKRNG